MNLDGENRCGVPSASGRRPDDLREYEDTGLVGEWLDDAMQGEASNWVAMDIAEPSRGLTTVLELLMGPGIELRLDS